VLTLVQLLGSKRAAGVAFGQQVQSLLDGGEGFGESALRLQRLTRGPVGVSVFGVEFGAFL
jgi:hypothetical protein